MIRALPDAYFILPFHQRMIFVNPPNLFTFFFINNIFFYKFPEKHGFDGVLELLSISHDLSVPRNMQLLSDASFNNTKNFSYNSRRVEKTLEYLNTNFDKPITLSEVAKLTNMTQTAFSRFFKTRTGINFINSLNDIRLGHATSRKLIKTTDTLSEIAYNWFQ